MKVKINRADSFEGPAYQYTDQSDGHPTAVLIPVVTATGVDGKLYQLPNSVKIDYDEEGFQIVKLHFTLTKARELEEKIRIQGFINSEYWVELTHQDMKEYLCGSYGAV